MQATQQDSIDTIIRTYLVIDDDNLPLPKKIEGMKYEFRPSKTKLIFKGVIVKVEVDSDSVLMRTANDEVISIIENVPLFDYESGDIITNGKFKLFNKS